MNLANLSKKPELFGTIALPVYEQFGFLFRQSLGEGEFNGEPFEISINVNGDSFFVGTGGRFFSVSTREICAQILQQVLPAKVKKRKAAARGARGEKGTT